MSSKKVKKETINNQVTFKIRDRLTGLYAGKGSDWTKLGKSWPSLGQFKAHIRCLNFKNIQDIPIHWEIIICFELQNTNIPISSVMNMQQNELLEFAIQMSQWNITTIIK